MLTAFTCLITLQFVVVAAHDLVDIPVWSHGRQVQAVIGRRKLRAAVIHAVLVDFVLVAMLRLGGA
jgi:hypothetical protein